MTDIKALEVLQPSAVESITRAEVDVAIATARNFPRQLAGVKQSMLQFATLDQETAEGCFYTLPRGGKTIQGPSVRLAEIAVSCYGNLQAGSRIIAVVPTGETPHVVVQAVAKDLEKNITISVEKRRRITKKRSKDTIDEDDINLAANACSAICFRDAVFKVIPLALIKPVFEAARKVAIGDAKTLVSRRVKCLETFAKMGVTQQRVLAKLEVKSVEEIGLDHLEILIGLHNAIKEGEVNIDEAFALAATPTTGPAPTAFQRAQAAAPQEAGDSPAPSIAPTTTPPQSAPTPQAQQEQPAASAPAPAEQPRRRGRPPGQQKPVIEKFTPAEAAELINAGQSVSPGAIEGGQEALDAYLKEQEEAKAPAPQAEAGLSQSEQEELAAAGLAPEPQKPAVQQSAPAVEGFKPVPGESEAVTDIRRLCHKDGVTEGQVMSFMKANALSAGEVQLKNFTENQRESKLVALKKVWGMVIEKIKAQPKV